MITIQSIKDLLSNNTPPAYILVSVSTWWDLHEEQHGPPPEDETYGEYEELDVVINGIEIKGEGVGNSVHMVYDF